MLFPHFINKGMKARRGKVSCLRLGNFYASEEQLKSTLVKSNV